jgi:uncharacterized protein (DUF305 family)
MRTTLLACTTALFALLLTACAVQPVTPADSNAAAGATPAGAMDHSAHMQADDDTPFDAAFIDSMIEHHQGAIDMAQMVLDESEQPELRALAEAIIAAQEGEIAQMQTWRAAWFADLPPTTGIGMAMGDMSIAEDADKPFEQRFIEAMISHHLGAVEMADMALEMSERAEIRTLAEAIIAAQEVEIEQMRGWLADWYGVTN